MQFILSSKIALYTMCVVVAVTLLKNILFLHRTAWRLLPVNVYEENKLSRNKYILLWTSPTTVPFVYMGEGQSGFISRNCRHTNCIVTANRKLLSDYRLYDVIAFHGPELSNITPTELFNMLPTNRSWHQQYVFASIESPVNYPLCSEAYDNFFNWTWTYKLDSDVRWGYFVIKDSVGNVIGPNKIMNWINWSDMRQVSDNTKEQLKSKTKAVAWFVSNCYTESKRESFAFSLKSSLRKYNYTLDIFGDCSHMKCSRERENECNKMIEKDYYFYLSFENALSEDYVTEKLLIPLQNNAIPIVYGGANYTRYLPDGSYLNAKIMGVKKLARTIINLIRDPEKYAQYFKWKNHYSYHKMSESAETDEYCKMCEMLNDEEIMMQTSVYHNFYEWWDKQVCITLPNF